MVKNVSCGQFRWRRMQLRIATHVHIACQISNFSRMSTSLARVGVLRLRGNLSAKTLMPLKFKQRIPELKGIPFCWVMIHSSPRHPRFARGNRCTVPNFQATVHTSPTFVGKWHMCLAWEQEIKHLSQARRILHSCCRCCGGSAGCSCSSSWIDVISEILVLKFNHEDGAVITMEPAGEAKWHLILAMLGPAICAPWYRHGKLTFWAEDPFSHWQTPWLQTPRLGVHKFTQILKMNISAHSIKWDHTGHP